MRDKQARLEAALLGCREVAVAFSGGVDSTFLLHAACAVLGPDRVHAFHAGSDLIPAGETRRVAAILESLGCRSRIFSLDPFLRPEFVANPPDRCYHCKKKVYEAFAAAAREAGIPFLLDGTNADDLLEDRPGLKVLTELQVQTPLAAVGLTKKEIRCLSRKALLPTWNAHSASCLATRIASGEPITREKIFLVARCEAHLAEQGFFGTRVRLAAGVATIEVVESDLGRIAENDVISMIQDMFFRLGLRGVQVSPQGRPRPDLE